MNVYDFDNTLLKGDSTARFFAYCLGRYPRMWLDIPAQAANGLLFALRLRQKQPFKQRMLHFLALIGDVDEAVDAFWRKNFSRIKKNWIFAASWARRWTSAPVASSAPTATARRRSPGSTPAFPGRGSRNSTPIPTRTIPWPPWQSGPIWSRGNGCCPGEGCRAKSAAFARWRDVCYNAVWHTMEV